MAQSYAITSFATGEISNKFAGRVDLPQYLTGCKVMQNMFPHPTGGAEKRPGTMYAGTAAGKCLLIPWIKSESEYLILELSAAKIRYYSYSTVTRVASLILSSGTPVETSLSAASWIAEANLPDVKYVQDSVTTVYDTMYFACPGFTLRKLVRTSDTSWAFSAASLTDYAGTNASSCELFEDRLILTENNILYGSKTADHLVFSAASPAVAEDGFSFVTAAKENSVILWTAASDTLLYGTASSVFRVAGKNDVLSGETLAIWPSKQTAIGCSKVQPVIYNEYLVFVQRGGKRLHIVAYSQDADLYQANDVTFYADHIAGSGVVQLAFQRNPEPILWAITSDGDLISMVYSHTTQTVGWSKHDVGGTVESICVIQTTGEDVLVLSILKGSSRFVCTMPPRDYGDLEDAHFVDLGISVKAAGESTVTSVTPSQYVVGGDGEAGGHVFYINGNVVYEAAPVSTEMTAQYSGRNTQINAMETAPWLTAIGEGDDNTTALVTWLNADGQTGKAAQLCDALSYGGYSDWFMPSKNELIAMYDNLKIAGIGGFSSTKYWSSTEEISSYRTGPSGIIYYYGDAYNINFLNKSIAHEDMISSYKVRAVRTHAQSTWASVVTSSSHGFTDGQLVTFSDVVGENDLNGNVFMVKNPDTHTFELYESDGVRIATVVNTGTGGTVKLLNSLTVSGLDHLEGETVQVFGDAEYLGTAVVASGDITVTKYLNKIHIGLPYTAILEPNNIAVNNYKLKRIVEVYVKFLNSISCKIGKDTSHLKTFDLQEGAPIMGDEPVLTTTNLLAGFPADFKDNPSMVIVSDLPFPMTVLNIVAEVET